MRGQDPITARVHMYTPSIHIGRPQCATPLHAHERNCAGETVEKCHLHLNSNLDLYSNPHTCRICRPAFARKGEPHATPEECSSTEFILPLQKTALKLTVLSRDKNNATDHTDHVHPRSRAFTRRKGLSCMGCVSTGAKSMQRGSLFDGLDGITPVPIRGECTAHSDSQQRVLRRPRASQ